MGEELAEWIVISPDSQELTPACSCQVRDPVAMHAGPVPDLQDGPDGPGKGQPPAATPNPPGNPAVDADILAVIRRDRAQPLTVSTLCIGCIRSRIASPSSATATMGSAIQWPPCRGS